MAGTDIVPISDYRALVNPQHTMDLIRETLAGQQVSEFDLARVKMPAGGGTVWSVPGLSGEEPQKVLSGVVLFSKFSRGYWESKYEGGNEPPDCSSPDAEHATPREDFTPPAPVIDADATPPVYGCNGCQLAEWGSQVRDGQATRGQACKLTRQLFILGPERMLPMVVSLPPTSLKPAQQHFLTLADFGVDHRAIVTNIELVKVSKAGVPDFSQAKFSTGEKIAPEQAASLAEYANMMRASFERIVIQTADEVGGDAA